jgi:branched-chain amino acid transport system permease protein
MSASLFLEQGLNGLQFGVMLFLMAAGVTLVVGVMNLVNLTHGSLYMLGAYFGAYVAAISGSFILGIGAAIAGTALVGLFIERLVFRKLYERNHLDQVLATFGLALFFDEIVVMIWGRQSLFLPMPTSLSGAIDIGGLVSYPIYRLAITAAGLAIGAALALLINRTRLGMLIRAGATHAEIVAALGANIRLVYLIVFCIGCAMAGISGCLIGPLISVDNSMGDTALTLGLVVTVIGGLGSVRGAFVAAVLLGIVDTYGRSLLPVWFGYPLGPALSSVVIYFFMAVILMARPQGLFPIARPI